MCGGDLGFFRLNRMGGKCPQVGTMLSVAQEMGHLLLGGVSCLEAWAIDLLPHW